MNTKKRLGILLEGGQFDKHMRDKMREFLRRAYNSQKKLLKRKPTREEFGETIGMDRWRITRLLKGLKITDLF